MKPNLNVDVHLKNITRAALHECGGNRTNAARILGISIRTLRNWIRKYKLEQDIPPPRSRSDLR